MTLVIGGAAVLFPDSVSYLDDPKKVPHATDGRARADDFWERAIVLHTVAGKKGPLRPGVLASLRDLAYARYQAHTERDVSWHATLDTDASVAWSADPLRWQCWHAQQVNAWASGVELVQDTDGSLYAGQMARLVLLLDTWTRRTGTPRIFPKVDGAPFLGMIGSLLSSKGGGAATCGIYGHVNVYGERKITKAPYPYKGLWDPGPSPFLALDTAGYIGVDFNRGEDREVVRSWQLQIGVAAVNCDGVWGPQSRALAARVGFQAVPRPGDVPAAP